MEEDKKVKDTYNLLLNIEEIKNNVREMKKILTFFYFITAMPYFLMGINLVKMLLEKYIIK